MCVLEINVSCFFPLNCNDWEMIFTELELMKERFSRLLLGEDMSGSGKGVCTAVAISNAITNLYGTSLSLFCVCLPPLSLSLSV